MEKLIAAKKEYQIISLLKEDEFHKSYKCERNGKLYFVKVFLDAPSFQADASNHKILKKYGINIPKLIKSNKKDLTNTYQFIDGDNVLQVIARQELDEIYYEQLFHIYRFARFSKIELDYHPENYVLYNNELYYLSHNFIPQNQEKNLENFGIYFWFYSDELAQYLKENNLPVDKKRILSKGEVNKKIVLTSIMKW